VCSETDGTVDFVPGDLIAAGLPPLEGATADVVPPESAILGPS
jgi:hypothetical protein